jgi:ADP-dependent NAD(P)H-hydrate dehydratase / NAD(P)H-hydrate epimerase
LKGLADKTGLTCLAMKIVTAQEMVEFEKQVIAGGVSAADLMEQAGRSMARIIRSRYPASHEALIVVGKGNNGGDGLVVARHLAATGWTVRVLIPEGDKPLRELPRKQLDVLSSEHPAVMVYSQWHESLFPKADGIVVDALLGVGTKGALRGVMAEVVAAINAARTRNFFRTVALDLPTGLPDDPEHSIVADLTITVGYVKDFLVRESLAAQVGGIETVPLFSDTLGAREELLDARTLSALLPRRSALSHKNTYGRALIIGGCPGFIGAPVLAAQAALRSGAGLTSLATRIPVCSMVAALCPPEVMVQGVMARYAKHFSGILDKAAAVAVGPGLGTDAESQRTLAFVLKHATGPLVVDADALTLLAAKPALFKTAKTPLILTPHPGEMKRLLGRDFTLDERPAVARELSDKYQCVVVLKGTRTIIASPVHPVLYYNSTGNPGMAVGGSGDTLTGIVTALLAQGLAPADAARLGVWLHGRAADIALSKRDCEEGLLPTDVVNELHAALGSLRARE